MSDTPQSNDATSIFRMPSTDATVPDLMGSQRLSNPTLSIVKGPHTGTTFVLDTPEITIGRDPSNSVFLNDMTVSRHHAKMHLVPGANSIEDLGSLNGTWVDGAIINRAMLEDGSTIQVGTFRMIFHTTQNTSRIPVEA
ncbi:FHA domain-containing protein [Olsenella sp. KGMB02461]|jgi:pSer/pThr/pTyr-binding forkhead associated (FHA) protein|uniref:FHA domain-containing protein n=2 Tax=Coriobacteriales TaxID=84999 RepID=A0A4S2EYR6_9ACTN|nr:MULTISPECIES: FHA domain-containing protein [Atopobiaceae]MCI8676341.1 FHA domain-containing protein [Atopobiaceae bacterium]NLQ12858.1 FHA domain-containing protein [Olsenella sp. KGMB02461]TGY61668.1 FHA domain-containing protein [Muricaecibacterium torontonense]BDC90927.1 oxoglutarate dehydrogenase inhibitor [Leptogranulimonas caecicola]